MANITTQVAEIDASYDVYAQAKYLKRSVLVYKPNQPFKKLKTGMELHEPPDRSSEVDLLYTESNLERSIRRTKVNIKDITQCNDFELLATFTIASDRQNLARSKQKLASWVKNEIVRKGKFEYILVPEFHKDGESLHFHGLFKGYQGRVLQSFNDRGYPIIKRGRKYYQLPSFTSGFTNVEKVDNSVGSIAKVGYYLQKYITKDMPMLFGKNRYWASHGLKRPIIEDNPELWYEAIEPDSTYETDYGTFLEFNAGSCALVDMYIEANQP